MVYFYSFVWNYLYSNECFVNNWCNPWIRRNTVRGELLFQPLNALESIIRESGNSIPYVKFNETVRIKLGKNNPDTYELKDSILNIDGTLKYKVNSTQAIDLKFEGGEASFILGKNISVYLSSDSNNYEKGTVIRGFRLIWKKENVQQEIAFVMKTDATEEWWTWTRRWIGHLW